MLILRLAWRNMWRNTRRTAITLAAVSLNAAILITAYALMDGMLFHMVSSATNIVMGEAQIHVPKYLVDRSMYKDLRNSQKIIDMLREQGIPATGRSYGYGLVARETKSAGALFWGVDPVLEAAVFDLPFHVARGSYLSPEPKKGMVLGKKLARSLNANIGTEIVVVVQAADGSLGNELFQVTGILKAAGDAIDRSAAILHQKDFEALFVSDGRIHEIALNSKGAVPLEQITAFAEVAAPKADVKTWRQLLPSLSDMVNFMDAAIWIFGIVFFLAAALGVMNTMLMATFERIREFGILKAIGTTPWQILRDVAAEAFLLGLLSTLIGAVIGIILSYYFQVKGLDISIFATGDVSVAGVAFDPIWRAVLSTKVVLIPLIVMWLVCLLASLYPAAIAARLDPVKAMTRV